MDDLLSDSFIAAQFADVVDKIRSETKAHDEAILHHPVEVVTTILSPLAVELHFIISEDIIGFIAHLLWTHSPRGSGADKHPGRYAASHKLYGDGILVVDISKPPSAKEFIFVNELPYAGKIASGESSQAPNGVYEVVANESQRKFPSVKIAYIDYGKFPAIQVNL